MNETRFDVVTRWAGRPTTRRVALGSLGVGIAAFAVGGVAAQEASPVATPASVASPEADCPEMSAAETEALARRFVEERWTNPDELAEILADDFVAHRASGVGEFTAAEALERYREFQVGLPDVVVTVERVVVEQDTVAVLWVAKGTHLGEFDGVPPTGRSAHLGRDHDGARGVRTGRRSVDRIGWAGFAAAVGNHQRRGAAERRADGCGDAGRIGALSFGQRGLSRWACGRGTVSPMLVFRSISRYASA